MYTYAPHYKQTTSHHTPQTHKHTKNPTPKTRNRYLGLMFTSHLLALFVALLVEKPAMKLQRLFLPPAPAADFAKPTSGKGSGVVKKERPRVLERPNEKYMLN